MSIEDQAGTVGIIAGAITAVVAAITGLVMLGIKAWQGMKKLVALAELLDGLPDFYDRTERFMTDTDDRFHSVEKSLRRIEDKLDSSSATVDANTQRLMKVEAQVAQIKGGIDEQHDQ